MASTSDFTHELSTKDGSSTSDPTSDFTAEESILNSSGCTVNSGSDGINGDQDDMSSEEDDDDEINELFQAVKGKHP